MAAGDEAALSTLYDLWSERVHSIAYWILKDPDEADDVVEETFWQAWRTADRYDRERSAASTWLMVMARSRALDRLRSRRRRTDWSSAPLTLSRLRDEAEPVDHSGRQLELADEKSLLASVLPSLPADQRAALEMAYFEGLTHGEIAQRTSQPLGTVKTRIRLAMQKLRQALGQGSEVGS